MLLASATVLWGKTDGLHPLPIDGTTWQRAATYEYGPFGEILRASGPEAATNRYRFSGKFTDPATGLLYFGHRWYDPDAGRWLSRDPLGEVGGLNLYGYAANDPVNFVDGLGLDREKFINILEGVGNQAILGNLTSSKWHNGSQAPATEFELLQWDLMLKGRLGKIAEESAAFTDEEILAGEKAQCIGEFAGKFQNAWRNELAGMKADYRLERQIAREAAASVSPIDRMTANMKANFASDIRMAVWISTYDQVFVALGGTHYNPWVANAHDPGNAWQEVSFGEQLMTGVNLATLPLLFMSNPCRPLVAPKGPVVYRELSAADRIALDAGQPLMPKGSGGTILDHVRGQPTGHISVSESAAGTVRFNGGNGLVEIDVNAATAGGARYIPHPEVIESVGDRAKQIQKVLESQEALFEGPIPAGAIRLVK